MVLLETGCGLQWYCLRLVVVYNSTAWDWSWSTMVLLETGCGLQWYCLRLVVVYNGAAWDWSWSTMVLLETGCGLQWCCLRLVLVYNGTAWDWLWSTMVLLETGCGLQWCCLRLVVIYNGTAWDWLWSTMVLLETGCGLQWCCLRLVVVYNGTAWNWLWSTMVLLETGCGLQWCCLRLVVVYNGTACCLLVCFVVSVYYSWAVVDYQCFILEIVQEGGWGGNWENLDFKGGMIVKYVTKFHKRHLGVRVCLNLCVGGGGGSYRILSFVRRGTPMFGVDVEVYIAHNNLGVWGHAPPWLKKKKSCSEIDSEAFKPVLKGKSTQPD